MMDPVLKTMQISKLLQDNLIWNLASNYKDQTHLMLLHGRYKSFIIIIHTQSLGWP